jgi:two-component system response regulator AlgR
MSDGLPAPAAPLRVLIVDDEPLARRRLRRLLDETSTPATEVVGEAGDAAEALAHLQRGAVDLVLLDVAMPGTGGLDAARRWAALPSPPLVVFVTAHGEHALAAFDLDAADYLTKPVRQERLQAALERAARRRSPAPRGGTAVTSGAPATVAPPVIVVNDRGRVTRVPLPEVLYLKAELKYVTLRTATGRHLLDESLADLEQRLGGAFLRVHRNALVAVAAVRELQRRPVAELAVDAVADEPADLAGGEAAGEAWAVRVAPTDEWLAVSRRQLQAVRQVLAPGR